MTLDIPAIMAQVEASERLDSSALGLGLHGRDTIRTLCAHIRALVAEIDKRDKRIAALEEVVRAADGLLDEWKHGFLPERLTFARRDLEAIRAKLDALEKEKT